jgi:hypothetical protein
MEEIQLLTEIRDTLMQINKSMDDKWKLMETWKDEYDKLGESRWETAQTWMNILTEARSDLKDIRDRINLVVQL